MFSDLLARLFVTAFFITYGVVMIFLLKWSIGTWPRVGRRRSPVEGQRADRRRRL